MNEIFISTEDLKTLFFRLKYKLKRIAFISAAAVFVFCLSKEPVYVAEATFRQSAGHVEQSIDLKNFVKTMLTADVESSTIALMFSQKILRRVVEDLGMQAEAHSSKPWKILDNLRAEGRLALPDPEPFIFSHVVYEKETPLAVFLRFLSFDAYEILDKKGERIVAGRLKERIEEKDFQLTLEAPPKHFKIGKKYPLTLTPWKSVVAGIKPKLSIKPAKLDKAVLQIHFSHRNPTLAAQFINQLMSSYQTYLKEENETLAAAQLGYLSRRQDEVSLDLEKNLKQHVAYLKSNIGLMGTVGYEKGSSVLTQPHEEYTAKLFNVEYELARLEKTQQEQIAQGNEKLQEAAAVLHCLEKGDPLPALKTTLAGLLQDLKKTETEQEAQHAKSNLCTHLRSMIQNMHRHQKALQEVPEADMRGIDLATAKELYLQYSNEIDALRVNTRQLQFFLTHIQEPSFELSSLCRILTDSITQEMVQKAGALEFQLHDELTHSGKEHERVKEALATQKKFIARHLAQTVELEKIHIDLIEEKLFALQKTMIDLLKSEKLLIEERLVSLRGNMRDLPEKWHLENTLKFKTDLIKSMIEGLSQFSESKSLSSHLYQVESKPIDQAYRPAAPQPPHLLLFSLGAALFCSFLTYLAFFIRGLVQGLPLSRNQLKILRLPFCGHLSSQEELSDNDLETMRKIAQFAYEQPSPSTIALLGQNYCPNLAQLLSLRGHKILVIDCDFSAFVSPEEDPGLWQFLTGQVLNIPIRKMGEYDLICAGKSSAQGAELLSSERFSLALSTLKPDYDCILLFSKAPFDSAEIQELLKHASSAVAFFTDETLDDAEPLQQWSRQKENSRLTFVKCEASFL